VFRGKLEVAKDSYDKSTAEILREYLDRWILCSQWAGQPSTGIEGTHHDELQSQLLKRSSA
jgi:hypothetical protein